MGEALINRTNPDFDDSYKVGDIALTTNSTMGDGWALCNGEIIENYPGITAGSLTDSNNFQKRNMPYSNNPYTLALRNYKTGYNITVSIANETTRVRYTVSIYGVNDALIDTMELIDTSVTNIIKICDGAWLGNNTIELITSTTTSNDPELLVSVSLNLNSKTVTINDISNGNMYQYMIINNGFIPNPSFFRLDSMRGCNIIGIGNWSCITAGSSNYLIDASNIVSNSCVPMLYFNDIENDGQKSIDLKDIVNNDMKKKYLYNITITSYAQTSAMTAMTLLIVGTLDSKYYVEPLLLFFDNATATLRGSSSFGVFTFNSLDVLESGGTSSNPLPKFFVTHTNFSSNSFTITANDMRYGTYITTVTASTSSNTTVPAYTSWTKLSTGGGMLQYTSPWVIIYKNKAYLVVYGASATNKSFEIRTVNSLTTSPSIGTTSSNTMYPLSSDADANAFMPIRNNTANKYGSTSNDFFPVYFQQATTVQKDYIYVFGGHHAPYISVDGLNAFIKYKE